MKKTLTLALALCLVLLAACGGQPASSLPQPSAPSSSQPAPQPEPQPQPAPYDPAVLTGLAKAEDYPEGRRIAAVVVDNYPGTRPQRGLGGAQIVFEAPVEYGITRFLALYEDYAAMPLVGPVRSSRDVFTQLGMPFQPLYVADGGSQVDSYFVEGFDLTHRILDGTRGTGATQADTALQAPYNRFTSGDLISAAVNEGRVDDSRQYQSTFFSFVNYNDGPRALEGGDATALRIPFSESYVSSFEYAASDGLYHMAQRDENGAEGVALADANTGASVAFTNLLVLFSDMEPHNGLETVDVKLGHGGVGYYFYGGRYEVVRWSKQSPDHALTVTHADATGEVVALNPGTSYVAIVDVEQAAEFSFGSPGSLSRLG